MCIRDRPYTYIPIFANEVTAQVDVVAKHFYSTCRQKDPDQTVLSTVPGFATQVQAMYQEMAPVSYTHLPSTLLDAPLLRADTMAMSNGAPSPRIISGHCRFP